MNLFFYVVIFGTVSFKYNIYYCVLEYCLQIVNALSHRIASQE